MDEPADPVSPARLRTMQIIAFAEALGLVVFAAVAVFLVQVQQHGQGMAPPQGPPILSLVGAAMLAGLSVISFVFTNFLRNQGVRRIARGEWQPPPGAPPAFSDADQLMGLYQTTMIIGLALVEGAGFVCCIAYLMEGQPWMLALVALAIVLQAVRFPSAGRLRDWLTRQLDRVEQERGRIDAV